MRDGRKHCSLVGRALTVGVMVALSGCSFSIGDTPEGVAEELIEGELAEELSLGEISATCEAPPDRDPGTTFTCTSPTDVGEVRWLATMEDESTVNVSSVNLLDDEDVAALEEAAVRVLEAEVGIPLGVENFDCGTGPLVIGTDGLVPCTLTDPTTGDLYDSEVEITDLEAGDFNVSVADQPR
jgi:hypothetical protein